MPFPREGAPPERKCQLGSGSNQRDQAAFGFVQYQTHRALITVFWWKYLSLVENLNFTSRDVHLGLHLARAAQSWSLARAPGHTRAAGWLVSCKGGREMMISAPSLDEIGLYLHGRSPRQRGPVARCARGSPPFSSHASVAQTATWPSTQGPASALRFNYCKLRSQRRELMRRRQTIRRR